MKKDANAVTSVTTKITAAMTTPLAASTVVRRGTVASVVRMEPVAYSDVTTSAPRTPTTNWEMNSPVWENRTGSNWARSTTPSDAQRPASMLETSADRPIPATTITSSEIHVDRTDRALVHSDRMLSRRPARPSRVDGNAGSVTAIVIPPTPPETSPPRRCRGSRPPPT